MMVNESPASLAARTASRSSSPAAARLAPALAPGMRRKWTASRAGFLPGSSSSSPVCIAVNLGSTMKKCLDRVTESGVPLGAFSTRDQAAEMGAGVIVAVIMPWGAFAGSSPAAAPSERAVREPAVAASRLDMTGRRTVQITSMSCLRGGLMSVAEVLEPLVRTALKASARVRIECWDGSILGPPDGVLRIRFVRRRALRWLLWSPNELGFARAYVAGDIELEGDIVAAISGLDALADAEHGLGVQVDAATKAAIARAVIRLGAVGPPPRPPAEETRLSRWRRHTPVRDALAISHHYDVGNDFYALVLGPSMVYSCAYFEQSPSPSYTLQDAQRAKLDLVAKKLNLAPGQRVLDVGCGWGGFVIHAAREYGVHATGITLSAEQAAWARDRVRAEGLQDLVEIRVQDYREVHDGPYDAIASIGMAEHVGLAQLPGYAIELHALLASGGRLLNHAISRRPGSPNNPRDERQSFVYRYVFPDGELEPMATMVDALENAGFEVRDVQSIREHYALTLRAWVANLEREWDRAVELGGAGRTRVWWLYMAGSALQFQFNRIGVNQVLAIKPAPGGISGMPLTRAELLGADQRS